MGKGTCMCNCLKLYKIDLKILVKNFFEKKTVFFSTQHLKTSIFGYFGWKFDKSTEPAELNRHRDVCYSAKWQQINPYEKGEKSFKMSPQKFRKSYFWPINGEQWPQNW